MADSIVVMKQLDSELHFWLSNLRKYIPEPTFRDIIIRMHCFTTKQEKEYAKAYFGALAEYNKQLHAKTKEEPTMNEYMKEFYREELEASYSKGQAQGQDKVNSLNKILIAAKRFVDLEKAANDLEYQNKLMRDLLPAQ